MFQEISRNGRNGKVLGWSFTDFAQNLVTSRLGGISKPPYDTLNLSFKGGDDEAHVITNRQIAAKLFGKNLDSFVFANQVHGSKIFYVGQSDRYTSYGIDDLPPCDGLLTDKKGVVLAVTVADCPPVFFHDPVKNVIGVVHSGWRGTTEDISGIMLSVMFRDFKSDPVHIRAAIGPHICGRCYEVGNDVRKALRNLFSSKGLDSYLDECLQPVPRKNGKYRLDLGRVIRFMLIKKGLSPRNISTAERCTKCKNDLFFSHRFIKDIETRSNQQGTGRFGAFIALG